MVGEMEMLNQPDDGRSFLERIDMPVEQPAFMPNEFLDYLISRYQTHGFGPPHNWYRNYQRTFDRTGANLDDVLKVPAMYITGTRGEWPVELAQVMQLDELERFSDMRVTGMIEAGHWLGQEVPEWVNQKIGEFLQSIS